MHLKEQKEMSTKTQEIRIEEFDYPLPDERIAKFPLQKRDESKLLLYRNGEIGETVFKHITDYLPEDSLMVFNNTRVIQARLLFQKPTVSLRQLPGRFLLHVEKIIVSGHARRVFQQIPSIRIRVRYPCLPQHRHSLVQQFPVFHEKLSRFSR